VNIQRKESAVSEYKPEIRRRSGTHGAGWLHRLLFILQSLLVVATVTLALWLLFSFPLLKPDPLRSSLPVVIDTGGPVIEGTDNPLLEGLRWASFRQSTRTAYVKFSDAWVQWWYLLIVDLAFVLSIWELNLVRRVVRSVASGDPFTAANARLLRIVGALLLLESVTTSGAERLFNEVILNGIFIDGGRVLVEWGGAGWFSQSIYAAWIVLILSEVFRQGAALRDEQSLTV
jgi:hypothetical protein